jgi:hypothetical protein
LDLSGSVDVFATPTALTLDGNEQAVAITLPAGSYSPRVLQIIGEAEWWLGRASGGGRKRTIPAVTDGVCDAAGTAGWWAIVDVSEEALLAANALSATQVIALGIPVTCTAFDIGIPDAVSE